MEIKNNNLYTARQAGKDYIEKVKEKESFVNEEKIIEILRIIKEQIHSLEINSKTSFTGYREYKYLKHLSKGEQNFLKKLGYKVEFKTPYAETEHFYKIIW